jgi:DNA-binding HxlR family transcriptional regulator
MGGYGQFCPVAKATEVLCQRWTPLIVRELLLGSRRFNEIHRGVPLMSPTLLSQRLRDLQRAGVVRADDGYELTVAGRELAPIIAGLSEWGQRWVRSDYREDDLDPGLLLWDLRRYVQPNGLGVESCVIEFRFPAQPPGRRCYWFVIAKGDLDVCLVDPGQPVDVVLTAGLDALTKVWMGDATFGEEQRAGRIQLTGPTSLVGRVPKWLGQHPILAAIGPGDRDQR